MGKSFVHELIAALLIDNFQMTVLAIFWFFPNKLVNWCYDYQHTGGAEVD